MLTCNLLHSEFKIPVTRILSKVKGRINSVKIYTKI